MTEAQPSIDEILDALTYNDGVYPREMIDAAIERRTEIIPQLIGILRQVIADPSPYIENEDRFEHVYALMLLGHFRATEAHEVILDLLKLPETTLEEIYGDILGQELPTVLANTSGGNLEGMKSVALDRSIGVYDRISVLQGMNFTVADRAELRDEVAAFFGTLFTGDEADADSDFWGLLAALVCDIYPEENMPAIRAAFKAGWVTSEMIGFEAFEQVLEDGKEAALEELRTRRERFSMDDLHASMQKWACFEEGDELFVPTGPEELFASSSYAPATGKIPKKTDKAKKKKKRKQVRASKRRNR